MNDNDPTWRARALAKFKSWVLAGCKDDPVSLDTLEALDLSDEDLEALFRPSPRGVAPVPHGGRVR